MATAKNNVVKNDAALIDPYNNVVTKIEEGVLTITIVVDESKLLDRKSGSGKSRVLATTGGNRTVGMGGLKLGLNLYRSA